MGSAFAHTTSPFGIVRRRSMTCHFQQRLLLLLQVEVKNGVLIESRERTGARPCFSLQHLGKEPSDRLMAPQKVYRYSRSWRVSPLFCRSFKVAEPFFPFKQTYCLTKCGIIWQRWWCFANYCETVCRYVFSRQCGTTWLYCLCLQKRWKETFYHHNQMDQKFSPLLQHGNMDWQTKRSRFCRKF